jgi:hypothetical protein
MPRWNPYLLLFIYLFGVVDNTLRHCSALKCLMRKEMNERGFQVCEMLSSQSTWEKINFIGSIVIFPTNLYWVEWVQMRKVIQLKFIFLIAERIWKIFSSGVENPINPITLGLLRTGPKCVQRGTRKRNHRVALVLKYICSSAHKLSSFMKEIQTK